jgi:hypothetical protein
VGISYGHKGELEADSPEHPEDKNSASTTGRSATVHAVCAATPEWPPYQFG